MGNFSLKFIPVSAEVLFNFFLCVYYHHMGTDHKTWTLLIFCHHTGTHHKTYAFVRVCLFVPCGLLLGKGRPLGSRLWCLTESLSLSHWYLGSGVVLDCMDS